jgi:hypothetical protein
MTVRHRTRAHNARNPSKSRSLNGAARRRKARDNGAVLQRRVFRVFEKQADSLWSRLAWYCREFADGFNRAVGSPALVVEANSSMVRVVFAPAETELLLQLDKSNRLLVARVNNGCDSAVCTDCSPPLPVGLTVNGTQLQLVLRGDVTPDEQVAITLLRELTDGTLG